jgi:hypothetical protein
VIHRQADDCRPSCADMREEEWSERGSEGPRKRGRCHAGLALEDGDSLGRERARLRGGTPSSRSRVRAKMPFPGLVFVRCWCGCSRVRSATLNFVSYLLLVNEEA